MRSVATLSRGSRGPCAHRPLVLQPVPEHAVEAAGAADAAAPSLGPESPGNQLYRFEAVELKALNHRLDGVLWPLRPGSPWCSSTPRRAICGWWWWCPIARIQALLDFSGAEDLAVWREAHAG